MKLEERQESLDESWFLVHSQVNATMLKCDNATMAMNG